MFIEFCIDCIIHIFHIFFAAADHLLAAVTTANEFVCMLVDRASNVNTIVYISENYRPFDCVYAILRMPSIFAEFHNRRLLCVMTTV